MSLRPRWLRVLHLASASASLLLVTNIAKTVHAQSPATLQAFEKEPHLGNIEEALVGITVVNTAQDGSVQTRHGNGLMLRCDGFVLVPEALFFTDKAGNNEFTKPNQSVTVVLHPGTAQQQSVKGRRPGWFGWVEWGKTRQHLGYAVLKLDNTHCPAMRALMPDTLTPGSKLTVAWSTWDESRHAFGQAQTRQVAVGERKAPAADDNTPALYREQFTPFQQTLEATMPGAIVFTDEEFVVGILPGNTPLTTSRFANFASLTHATNCVTALPTGDSAFLQRRLSAPAPFASHNVGAPIPPTGYVSPLAQQAQQTITTEKRMRDVAAAAPDMVSVPGGPVKLPSALMSLQLDMEASNVACVAPFLVDRYEVTNEQYWEFWKALPDKVRADPNMRADLYPYGWGKESEPFPKNLAQVPVLGVRLPGARAYAKWVGKRLPTPYEWCLAAFGPSGGNQAPDWAKRFLKQRKEVWNNIVKAHEQFARQNPRILPKFLLATKLVRVSDKDDIVVMEQDRNGNFATIQDETHPSISEFFHLPWFFYKEGNQDAAAWSKQTIEELTEPLFTEWNDPMYVLPVGSRAFDVSPYGAMDMVMNAKELVAPSPIFPWNTLPHPDWPFRETDRYMDITWGLGDPTQKKNLTMQQDSRYLPNLGFVSPEFVQTRLNDPETMLHLMSFGNNPLLLWAGTPNYISPGHWLDSVHSPIERRDQGLPWLAEDRSQYRMFSRRLRSASENIRPNSMDYVISDLSAYVSACAAMDEYNDILHPADDMIIKLQHGPIYNMVYYPGGGETILHHWVWDKHLQVVQSFKGNKLQNLSVQSFAPPSLEDKPTFVNGSWIINTGSFPVWRGMPRHFHSEMGHSIGLDHDRPYSDKDRPRYSVRNESGIEVSGSIRPLSPDTFLVAGGFRCVR